MKKIVSLLLVFVLVFLMSTTAFAADGLSTAGDTVFSYYNDDGEIVTIAITRTDDLYYKGSTLLANIVILLL